jgi:hypothetical protein
VVGQQQKEEYSGIVVQDALREYIINGVTSTTPIKEAGASQQLQQQQLDIGMLCDMGRAVCCLVCLTASIGAIGYR